MLQLERLFDEAAYLADNPDVAAAVAAGIFESGRAHFDAFGAGEGRDPSALFDTAFYLAQNPDVAAAVESGPLTAIGHFLSHGAGENRAPLAAFDQRAYLEANPDVAAAVGEGRVFDSAYDHFIRFGLFENRDLGDGTTLAAFAGDAGLQGALAAGDAVSAVARLAELRADAGAPGSGGSNGEDPAEDPGTQAPELVLVNGGYRLEGTVGRDTDTDFGDIIADIANPRDLSVNLVSEGGAMIFGELDSIGAMSLRVTSDGGDLVFDGARIRLGSDLDFDATVRGGDITLLPELLQVPGSRGIDLSLTAPDGDITAANLSATGNGATLDATIVSGAGDVTLGSLVGNKSVTIVSSGGTVSIAETSRIGALDLTVDVGSGRFEAGTLTGGELARIELSGAGSAEIAELAPGAGGIAPAALVNAADLGTAGAAGLTIGTGTDGNDVIIASRGDDAITLGTGNAFVRSDSGANTINLTAGGANLIDYSAASAAALAGKPADTVTGFKSEADAAGSVLRTADATIFTVIEDNVPERDANADTLQFTEALLQAVSGGTSFQDGAQFRALDFASTQGQAAMTGEGGFVFDESTGDLFLDVSGDTSVAAGGGVTGAGDDILVVRLTGLDALSANDFAFGEVSVFDMALTQL